MATWTNISDTALEPGKPARSVDALALRDNPVAIAEGAAGAPRIQNAAVADGVLGSEKFQSGTAERDWVLARTAAASVGVVGSYALLYDFLSSGQSATPGAEVAGSSLFYASISNSDGTVQTQIYSGGSPAGTWRLMGYATNVGGDTKAASLWLRIS